MDLRVFSREPWSADETLSLPSLETLEITSRDNGTTFVGPLIAAAASELVNLYITNPDELSPAASLDILRALKAPQNLLLLLFSFGELLLFQFPPSSLSALTGLETIEFARGSWSSSLLHSLCRLSRLTELYVDAVSGMSTAELRALVLPGTDSTHIPHLSKGSDWELSGFDCAELVDMVKRVDRLGLKVSGNLAEEARADYLGEWDS